MPAPAGRPSSVRPSHTSCWAPPGRGPSTTVRTRRPATSCTVIRTGPGAAGAKRNSVAARNGLGTAARRAVFPGKRDADVDEGELDEVEAIILSMTP